MKKIILILFTVIGYGCKAQTIIDMRTTDTYPYEKNNNYIKDIHGDLDKFVGVWKWTDPTNSNTYFEIEFFKVLHWNAINFNNYYEDSIFGNYKFVENGIIITNTLNRNITDNLNIPNTFPSMLATYRKPFFIELGISMTDVNKQKHCKANFEILDVSVNPMQATWHMYLDEQVIITPVPIPPIQPGFTLPNDVVLTKQ